MADPVVMERLKALARERGVSLATVVREALEEKSDEYRPKHTWIGLFESSEPADIASTLATERVPPRD
jgi:Ribbon-helix-helix protein, copG family